MKRMRRKFFFTEVVINMLTLVLGAVFSEKRTENRNAA